MKVCKCINKLMGLNLENINKGELYKYQIVYLPTTNPYGKSVQFIYSYDERILLGRFDDGIKKFEIYFEDLIESRKRKINNLLNDAEIR